MVGALKIYRPPGKNLGGKKREDYDQGGPNIKMWERTQSQRSLYMFTHQGTSFLEEAVNIQIDKMIWLIDIC